jgi:glutamine---fructose-6-phosphate transaminase (isomerizing)
MCGIFAILQQSPSSFPIKKTLEALKHLEYRGYDSCGIFYKNIDTNNYVMEKSIGKIDQLNPNNTHRVKWVLGHTRWATHGVPCEENAHPHLSYKGDIVLIHNGIIENHKILKSKIGSCIFNGTTDSEILVNYIQYLCDTHPILDFKDILSICSTDIIGSYSIVIYNKNIPDTFFLMKNNTPLVIGNTTNGYQISSDGHTFNDDVNHIIDPPDTSLTILTGRSIAIYNLDDLETLPIIKTKYTHDPTIITGKGEYKHYMLKEIIKQSDTIRSCLRGRLLDGKLTLEELDNNNTLLHTKRLLICACGTSYYSGLIGKYIIEELCDITVDVEQASEYRYRKSHFNKDTTMIVISQSGETADTLGALQKYKKKNGMVISICNVMGSTIAKKADINININVGPEIGVASTKAFTGQLCVLYLFAIWLAEKKQINSQTTISLKESMVKLPSMYEAFIHNNKQHLHNIAKSYRFCDNMLFMGRGYNYPVAMEGALKVKEISYMHAEGYSAAEMKHGPIALIDNMMPVVFIALKDSVYDKVVSNLQEIKSRGGKVICIINENNNELNNLIYDKILIPKIDEQLYPFLCIIPIQLFSYYLALERGCSIDQPRNLAKSVTVE